VNGPLDLLDFEKGMTSYIQKTTLPLRKDGVTVLSLLKKSITFLFRKALATELRNHLRLQILRYKCYSKTEYI